jgi:hypothetical protein
MPIWMPVTIMSAGATWQTVNTATLNADIGSGWNGFTVAGFIAQADLAVTGGSQVRITVQCPASVGTALASLYVGQAHASWSETSPQFAATPTQIPFNTGSSSVSLAAGGADKLSDEVAGSIPAANGLAYAFFISGNDHIFGHATLPTGGKIGFKNASDAATVGKSGYTSYTATAHAFLIKKIEVFA